MAIFSHVSGHIKKRSVFKRIQGVRWNIMWIPRRCVKSVIYFALFMTFAILFFYSWLSSKAVIRLPPEPVGEEYYNNSAFIRIYPKIRHNEKRTLKILLHTKFFSSDDWGIAADAFKHCPVSNCIATHDKSEIESADVLLFHAVSMFGTIFPCSLLSHHQMPKYRRPDQLWIIESQEPFTGQCYDFKKYKGVFNLTATYRTDSDIPLSYGKFIKTQKTNNVVDIASKKTGIIAWAASYCFDSARRQWLVREIQKHVKVDTFGECGEKTLPRDRNLSEYKFYLSFENAFCKDYITEKFYYRLQNRIIPIVSGGGNYKKIAPPHSYINVRDYASVKDLVDYIKYLDKNDTAYNEYFEWTREYQIIQPDKWCEICRGVNEIRHHQVYTDLEGWFNRDSCKQITMVEHFSKLIEGRAIQYGLI